MEMLCYLHLKAALLTAALVCNVFNVVIGTIGFQNKKVDPPVDPSDPQSQSFSIGGLITKAINALVSLLVWLPLPLPSFPRLLTLTFYLTHSSFGLPVHICQVYFTYCPESVCLSPSFSIAISVIFSIINLFVCHQLTDVFV